MIDNIILERRLAHLEEIVAKLQCPAPVVRKLKRHAWMLINADGTQGGIFPSRLQAEALRLENETIVELTGEQVVT